MDGSSIDGVSTTERREEEAKECVTSSHLLRQRAMAEGCVISIELASVV